MNKILTPTEAQRKIVFEQTAVRIHLPAVAIEKDFWVTEILNILFSLPYAEKMVFKGGTSLSKIWGVIRRFSEDIDIAIDHSLFGIEGNGCKKANRKSRHLYDLFKMLESGIADNAIANDELWETIRHHREIFTSIRDVDYTPDVRKRIHLIPPEDAMTAWKDDYDSLVANMIYEDTVPSFTAILEGMAKIEKRFREQS